MADNSTAASGGDFIRDIIDADLASGKHAQIRTRFPPEPNGYLHIGHAKSICLNFGLARDYDGTCNLRFDDTNPTKEEIEYVESIQQDVKWLGWSFGDTALYASDYFERMYELAEELIQAGKAYVCELSDEQIREYRGKLGVPGQASPSRNRPVEDSLDLFRRMRAGEFPDGAYVVRAKIDMAASNMKMRDPLMYRIRHAHHVRTGDDWCIYPMYDYAHPLSDAFESITHSICTLEFENNRELYDWFIDNTSVPSRPRQIEFARLNLGYTVMSKRKLLRLVQEGHVNGWDDPRMPTIAGMRRRGYTPEAIRAFCDLIGVAKKNSTVDLGKLEFAVRDDLNRSARRVMAVLDPIAVTIKNYPDGASETLTVPYYPPDIGIEGAREVPFAGRLFIERDDFRESPPARYKRLAPGRWVRLRYAYCIRCDEVVTDPGTGEVSELRCTYDPDSRGGVNPTGEKVWGVIHWVPADQSVPAVVRNYDRLFSVEKPDAGDDFLEHLNPNSLVEHAGARVEPSVAADPAGSRYQFERLGYFCTDSVDSAAGSLVFNRIIGLRDSWTATRPTEETSGPAAPDKSARSMTRPPKKSRAEQRAIARERNPALAARYRRYRDDLGIRDKQADLLSAEVGLGDLFEALLAHSSDSAALAAWVVNELPRDRSLADLPCDARDLAALHAMIADGTVSGAAGRRILAVLLERGGDPRSLVDELGLAQVSDTGSLAPIVDEILAAHPDKVEAYRAGKTGLIGFFVGQVMSRSGGTANAAAVKALLLERLG